MLCQDCNKPLKKGATKRCMPCYRINMAQRNRDTAPERMRLNNPMANLETRKKMSETLHRIGHKPIIRGGNGKPLSPAHQMLSDAIGCPWKDEFIVVTNTYRGSGLPTHYKIDIAHPFKKIAIEVDGNSHCALSRQSQDKKKELFLSKLGWTVIRFKNEEVLNNLEECLKKIYAT